MAVSTFKEDTDPRGEPFSGTGALEGSGSDFFSGSADDVVSGAVVEESAAAVAVEIDVVVEAFAVRGGSGAAGPAGSD